MKKNTKKVVAEVGAGIAVLAAAAAAGAYFLYGKDGAKNRKKVKSWMLKAKGEVLEKLENAKEVSEPMYNKIVAEVSKKYAGIKGIDKAELAEMVRELKGHWNNISKQVAGGQKKAKRKTARKKTTKKVTK